MFFADCLSEKVKNTKYKILCFFTEVVQIYIKRFDLLRFVETKQIWTIFTN